MKNRLFQYVLLALAVCTGANTSAKTYDVPPSSTTSINVPYISDEAMEECVKLYNEAKWLGEDIAATNVNQYNHASVDAYNARVSRHSEMISSFNEDCAGKQSESAFRAAKKLNQQQLSSAGK